MQVSIVEAKRDLSKLIRLLETGKEDTILVTRHGKPVIKMTHIEEVPISKRIGVARDRFKASEDFDAANDDVCTLLNGKTL